MKTSVVLCALLGLIDQSLSKVFDLTHVLDHNAPKWPTSNVPTKYNMTVNYGEYYNNDFWLTYSTVEFYEHLGTHIDAPFHFAQSGQRMHEIPIDHLYGPGVIIDVAHKARNNPKYGVTKADVLAYEYQYGRIEPGSIVLMDSGYHTYFPNAKKIFGTETPDNTSTFNFPAFTEEACLFLMNERQVSAVGVDTPSVDLPQEFYYPCHVKLQSNNIILIEFAANLGKVPRSGTHIFLGAVKHRDGSGGPTRIMALLDDPDVKESASKAVSFVPYTGFSIAIVCLGSAIRNV